jgi:hypothetical protein
MPSEPSSFVARRRLPLLERVAALCAAIASRWAGHADPRRYNRIFAAVVIPPVLVMLTLALWQEPLRGDLTRPGGYAEDQYGWNQPQERFSPPFAATRYDRPFDVVVLGDSFSTNPTGQTDPGAYWTNFVAQRTGLSVVAVSRFDMTLADLLRHPVFVKTPPRLLILETVERYLVRDFVLEVDMRMGRIDRTCTVEGRELPHVPHFRPIKVAPVPWQRDTRPEVDFDQAANFLWKAVRRHLFNIDTTRVIRLGLARLDLFSSRASDKLLIYDDELRKARFTTPEALDAAYCTLIAAQNQVQANGQTHFLFIAAPDKATAYADHLTDPMLRDLSPLPEFYERPGLNQIALVERLRDAIRCGVKDVYMPNDTHWGSPAHRIVAEATIDALLGKPGRPACGCRTCQVPAAAASFRYAANSSRR